MSSFPTSLPTPRTPHPTDAPALRWGVLAPGWIAGRFVEAVKTHSGQRFVAVASRSAERAAAFAATFDIPRAYGGYAELVADPEVDIVYIASPHSEHREQALLAIAAGKHVLLEKAFTRNAGEAREVVAAAAAAGVFLQEAMWTRFLPHIDVVRQLIADGTLGEISTVIADHGQYFTPDAASRLFDPNLAGGALLDLGIYPVSFASFALGAPASVTAVGHQAFTGVDGQITAVLAAADGAQAVVNTTLFSKTPTTASISGSLARLEIAGDFYAPSSVSLYSPDGDRVNWSNNEIFGHEGLVFQAAAAARSIAAGATESELMPLAETLTIMETMDEMRRQVGVTFPGE
ncbi:gfo/Idh/MocA family oxidoreductase [Nakamurella silvestris]|nr:gfo/Idh/MocA family oxidoreductase [Nakamurella silvestris]